MSGSVIEYYPSRDDATNKTNILASGYSRTIGEDLGAGESLNGNMHWNIYGVFNVSYPDIINIYDVTDTRIFNNGYTLPEFDEIGISLGYILYPANPSCCPDNTQVIGLSYDVRNDIRVGTIVTQMPPPRFSSYSSYYQMRMAKSAHK